MTLVFNSHLHREMLHLGHCLRLVYKQNVEPGRPRALTNQLTRGTPIPPT